MSKGWMLFFILFGYLLRDILGALTLVQDLFWIGIIMIIVSIIALFDIYEKHGPEN